MEILAFVSVIDQVRSEDQKEAVGSKPLQQAQRYMPGVPAMRKVEAEASPEAGSSRPASQHRKTPSQNQTKTLRGDRVLKQA